MLRLFEYAKRKVLIPISNVIHPALINSGDLPGGRPHPVYIAFKSNIAERQQERGTWSEQIMLITEWVMDQYSIICFLRCKLNMNYNREISTIVDIY